MYDNRVTISSVPGICDMHEAGDFVTEIPHVRNRFLAGSQK